MEYSIVISLSNKTLYLYQAGILVKKYLIGIGKDSTPTPTGNYMIISKYSNPGGVFGAMWLELSIQEYGIHGTNNPQSIGKKVSNGCIRMHNHDVLELSCIVPVGTNVIIRAQ